jgi:DNA invertase Pin-like site-specific DNA recombinase
MSPREAKKVFGNLRVSTSEQASSGDSLETQRQQVTGYAMMKGWQVAIFFVEAGVSGSVPLAERPEGKRLVEVVKPGDVVITPKLDRMFRSARRSSLRTGSVAIPAGAESMADGLWPTSGKITASDADILAESS